MYVINMWCYDHNFKQGNMVTHVEAAMNMINGLHSQYCDQTNKDWPLDRLSYRYRYIGYIGPFCKYRFIGIGSNNLADITI